MQIIDLLQGSPEWRAHRGNHFNASDAPAMMGCSPYKTRGQLLQELHTGLTADVDEHLQRRYDEGHRAEALARPKAEAILAEDLYPVVGVLGRLSASFDGITMSESTAFEHKLLGAELAALMGDDFDGAALPLHYRVQMQQQCMVSGATRVLFMASKWNGDELVDSRWCWHFPDPALAEQIRAGWLQFEADLAVYVPAEVAAPALAAPIESLPAVSVRLDGALAVRSNLPLFGTALRAFVEKIPTKPSTDQEFADTEAACKALKKAEEALDAAETNALASLDDVDAMRRMVADFKALARTTRLASEKMVETRKATIRGEIVLDAQRQLDEHREALNARLGAAWLSRTLSPFADAIKGKKTVASLKEAAGVCLANAKIAMSASADRLELNRKALHVNGKDWFFLFADFTSVGDAPAETFSAIAEKRIRAHQEAKQRAAETKPQPAAIEPSPAPAPALALAAACAPAVAADTRSPFTTGTLCKRLGFAVEVQFVLGLGIAASPPPPDVRKGAGTWWREADYPAIKAAIVRHVQALPDVSTTAREAVAA